MSNVRPWFRLSSIARPTSQASSDPPPPPQSRQTTRRPVVVRTPAKQPSPPRQRQPISPPSPPRQRPSSTRQQQTSSPPRQRPSPPRQRTPPPPQERSPYHSPPSRHMSPPTPPKAASPSPPTPPPRWSYTPPPPSLKEVQEAFPPRKPTSPPSPAHSARSVKPESETSRKAPLPRVLSPYSLPPPQLHSERETTQKNILTAEKTNQLQEPNHHNHNPIHQGNNTRQTPRQPSYSESENIMRSRVITIAGENKGAVMEILRSPSSHKTGGAGTHPSRGFHGTGEKGRKLQSSSSSSDEGEGKKKSTKNNNANTSNLPMKAFINSNVQMINNSIVHNSTSTHHDPGVHLKIFRTPGSDNGFHVKDYTYGKSGGGYTN
ncbi:putative extensin [Hirschfeldia incana]|nr:putative extensin [Hirschfeldia incana]